MYDVIVIGGGVAGLSAAIFTASAGLNTFVLNKGQSQIAKVKSVQNIPGFPEGISGKEWIEQAMKQVEKFNGVIKEEAVTAIAEGQDNTFEVKTEADSYQTKYLIIATNVNKDLLASLNLDEAQTNSFVPSGKAIAVPTVTWYGETKVKNLFLAGLVTEIPSQVSVVLGHGATVGIAVVSKEKGKPYMWHDV